MWYIDSGLLRQGVFVPSAVPVGRGRNPESTLKMADGLFYLALGITYYIKGTVTFAGIKLSAVVREEIDRVGCGFLQPQRRAGCHPLSVCDNRAKELKECACPTV